MSNQALVGGLALTALLGSAVAQAEDTLTVYTYDAFVSEWGPGPRIEKAFEAQCDCRLRFVALDGGVGILQRLELEGEDSAADVVLGLDMNLMAEARDTGLLAPHDIDLGPLALPVDWDDDTFVPFDWAPFAFVYDTQALAEPPHSFEELIAAPDDLKVIVEDPRTSTPGLGLLLWIKHAYGDRADEIWRGLQPHILTVTRDWSEAYFSLFMNGEAPMVLSYATSPAYHMAVEETDRYQAVAFDEGHYLQVEVAAMTRHTEHPDLAREFLDFMLSREFQRELPLTNVMYPAIDLGDALPEAFSRLIDPEVYTFSPQQVRQHRREWVDEWLRASTR
ncbi:MULTISPECIES: thiamine ABC transporter substrate binding subunit [unclassified Modicisalibacter]|uniref:thiamine ABC transporter substrate binding subunit n=1 Tax=unclassified Modicisalibacter TaxID=2679913 RepID=UPI001CCDD6E1|nr:MULTISPECIES: thiamine ABC transporter substrate binding subunit [unclassified Modicisalibacter]MBZ9557543.1 thiamine ABC transporter substrate binding subunit [Modicisalibacter sp. R2A 31.J]MBZ9573792.1 thiamine ABC transporter substrate binding subunit [Modicisalibacter sp. MOD 31.J]